MVVESEEKLWGAVSFPKWWLLRGGGEAFQPPVSSCPSLGMQGYSRLSGWETVEKITETPLF